MTDTGSSGDGNLTPADMRLWLREETATVNIAAKRRIEEATALVEEYTSGKLTPDEADERLQVYMSRWPARIARNEELENSIEEAAQKRSGTTRRSPRTPG